MSKWREQISLTDARSGSFGVCRQRRSRQVSARRSEAAGGLSRAVVVCRGPGAGGRSVLLGRTDVQGPSQDTGDALKRNQKGEVASVVPRDKTACVRNKLDVL